MVLLELIFVIVVVAYIWRTEKRSRWMAQEKKKYQLQTATYIKYDKRSVRLLAIGAILCAIVFGVSVGLMASDMDFWGKSSFSQWGFIAVLYGFFLGAALFLWCICRLFMGIAYLKRLERYGYEVPMDRKEYGYLLEHLPLKNVTVEMTRWSEREDTEAESFWENMEAYPISKTSKILSILSVLAMIVMVGLSFYYWYSWYFMDDDTIVMFVLLLIADVFWLVPILFFRKQMDGQKYKDDVEIDATRKNRMSLPGGILLILMLVGIALMIKNAASSMTEYVFKTCLSEDQKRVGEIQDALEVVFVEMQQYSNPSWENSLEDMQAGVDITTWGAPQDDFQLRVAECLGIIDFSLLRKEFRTTDGPAVVYVKLEGDTFIVQLVNVYPAADREIIAR